MAESIDDLTDELRQQLLGAPDDGTFVHLVTWSFPLDEPLKQLLLDVAHDVNPEWNVYASSRTNVRNGLINPSRVTTEHVTHVAAVRADRRVAP